jgi:hypothetical protein
VEVSRDLLERILEMEPEQEAELKIKAKRKNGKWRRILGLSLKA